LAAMAVASVREQCESIRYPYFSMLPVFVGKSFVQKETTHVLSGIEGVCFSQVSIYTQF
jgi:hypothetical protein